MSESSVISIREYENILLGEHTNCQEHTLSKDDFEKVEDFIRNNQIEDDGKLDNLLDITNYNGKKCLRAKQYVGVIKFYNGVTIEILPKTASDKDDGNKILLNILRVVKTLYKKYEKADLKVDHLPIFEAFIQMFVDSVLILEKHGFRSTYVEREENEPFCRGKLLISEQIRHNLFHAERFYVRYDDYNINRPINRLIKATLELLYSETKSWEYKREIRRLLDVLDEVPASTDYLTDYSKVSIDRGMEEFKPVLEWCMVFLGGKSFTTSHGSNEVVSLMFNMNKLFEDYVATKLAEYIDNLHPQHNEYYLFNKRKMFNLRPDIVINPEEEHPLVLDTKWKQLLNDPQKNYGISQADMYQMYIYHLKYNAKSVTLLYPRMNFDIKEEERIFEEDDASGRVTIKFDFVDLNWDDNGWKSFAEKLMAAD